MADSPRDDSDLEYVTGLYLGNGCGDPAALWTVATTGSFITSRNNEVGRFGLEPRKGIDRYDDDWSRIGWVLVRGTASVLHSGEEHSRAISLLRSRYQHCQNMSLETLPIIAVRVDRCTSWGNL